VDPRPRPGVLHSDTPKLKVPALATAVPRSARRLRAPPWLWQLLVFGQSAVAQRRHRRVQVEHMPAPAPRIASSRGRVAHHLVHLRDTGQQPRRRAIRAQKLRLDAVQRPRQGCGRRETAAPRQGSDPPQRAAVLFPERPHPAHCPRREEHQKPQEHVEPAVPALPPDVHPLAHGVHDAPLTQLHQQHRPFRQRVRHPRLVRRSVCDIHRSPCHSRLVCCGVVTGHDIRQAAGPWPPLTGSIPGGEPVLPQSRLGREKATQVRPV